MGKASDDCSVTKAADAQLSLCIEFFDYFSCVTGHIPLLDKSNLVCEVAEIDYVLQAPLIPPSPLPPPTSQSSQGVSFTVDDSTQDSNSTSSLQSASLQMQYNQSVSEMESVSQSSIGQLSVESMDAQSDQHSPEENNKASSFQYRTTYFDRDITIHVNMREVLISFPPISDVVS